MASKFRRGAIVYTSNGRSYVVDEVTDGVVYCSADSGAETEFSESSLLTEAEWNARSGRKIGLTYSRLRHSPRYGKAPAKVDRAGAETVLAKIERLMPGILDFTAFTIATDILADDGDQNLEAELSIAKCRAVWETATPQARASLLAAILATPADVLLNAARLGDNLMRALVEKGMAARATEFEEFCDRPRS